MSKVNKTQQFDCDVLVIGAGPGGYVAAIRAAQLGLKTVCVDAQPGLGGTCLNVGCIPSKSLLYATEQWAQLKSLAKHDTGVYAAEISFDLNKMMATKSRTIADLNKGIESLFRKNKVNFITGMARFFEPGCVEVNQNRIKAKNIIIATGSQPIHLPAVKIDNKRIVDSTGALSFEEIPERLVIVGAGAIGLEIGSVWNRLGSDVIVIELADSILADMDSEISSGAISAFEKQGMKFLLGHKLCGLKDNKRANSDEMEIEIESKETGEVSVLSASHLLLAVGRKPNTKNLNLAAIGIELDSQGRIPVNDKGQTIASGVYAIGDVTPGPMLAHRAEDEGVAVVENIAGNVGLVNHEVIPNIVYTNPEIASVGLTQVKAEAVTEIKIGVFPFVANSRAKVSQHCDGFVKIIADAKDETVLGVHIIGEHAGTMIAQAAQAMEFGATADDIAYTCHAHPTESEALKEAAMSVFGKAIHY